MTDKQIIIDGVDVAKCRCFTSEWDFNNCGHICKGTECKYKRLWYKKQLKRKEQECGELKQTLTEIKPILEFYANSNMGEEQPDKTYHIMLNGSYIMVYDPKPARQALQKICEVKNANI